MKAVDSFKILAAFEQEVTKASVVSYHYGFDAYKEKIAQVYPDLDSSSTVVIEEDAEKREIQREDAEEAPIEVIIHLAPEEALTKEVVQRTPAKVFEAALAPKEHA